MQLSYEISLPKAHANVQPYVILGTTPSAMIAKECTYFLLMGISSSVGLFFLTTVMVGKCVRVVITCVYKSNLPQMQWIEYEDTCLSVKSAAEQALPLRRYANAWHAKSWPPVNGALAEPSQDLIRKARTRLGNPRGNALDRI